MKRTEKSLEAKVADKQTKFLKSYSKINASSKGQFMERMQFDIFKRKTREQRVTQVGDKEKRQKSMTADEKENLYNRLLVDSSKRKVKKELY
jgi:hypothetical protein